MKRSTGVWVYAATPVLAALALADTLWAGGRLREALPASPAAMPLYGFVFGMPHIVASFFAFGDPALCEPSRRLIAIAFAVSALAVLLISALLGPAQAQVAIIVATMVHVMGQQSGLAAGAARIPPRHAAWVKLWKGLLALVACAVALVVGGEFSARPLMAEPLWWLQLSGVGVLASTLLAMALARVATSHGGDARPLLAAQSTLAVGWVLVAFGYPLLGIVLLRLVHDVTAFGFYVGLAAARERVAPRANVLYRGLGLRGRAAAWSVVPLALLIAGAASLWLPGPVLLVWVLMHYVTEHHVWRNGAPLRRALAAA